jgi:hypothetical protein
VCGSADGVFGKDSYPAGQALERPVSTCVCHQGGDAFRAKRRNGSAVDSACAIAALQSIVACEFARSASTSFYEKPFLTTTSPVSVKLTS